IISATATDPQGNTSEVSAARRGVLDLAAPSVRLAVGQRSVLFSDASGDGIALEDRDAGPFDPVWDLTLSVAIGTLTLSTTAGLTGSGDGTGVLTYSGPLSAIDAALEGMQFAPPEGFHGSTALSLAARSDGTTAEAQVVITDGFFLVTNTDD